MLFGKRKSSRRNERCRDCLMLFITVYVQAGNHFVWEFYRGKTLNVPASYGLLHHYRVCEFGGKLNIP